jgi:hypothetical protein
MSEAPMFDRVVHVDEIIRRTWTFAEYQAIDAVNWTTLKNLKKSPLHYMHGLTNERPDTSALKLGRVVHKAVFEPEQLPLEVVIWENGDRRGKAWEAFKAEHEGETILKRDEYDRACAIRDAVRAHPLVMPYLATGLPEQVVQWTDRRSGVPMKARVDWLSDAVVLDLKTARHAVDQRAFAADAFRLGYFHQLALYQRGVATMRGVGHGPPALIVAVEPVAPFDVAVYRLSDDALAFVGEELDELLELLVHCRAEKTWPGTFSKEQELDVPRWAMPSAEDMEVGDEPEWLKGA